MPALRGFVPYGEVFMFEGLDEQMKHDDQAGSTAAQRMLPWAIGVLATVVVLGGLYAAVRMMGG